MLSHCFCFFTFKTLRFKRVFSLLNSVRPARMRKFVNSFHLTYSLFSFHFQFWPLLSIVKNIYISWQLSISFCQNFYCQNLFVGFIVNFFCFDRCKLYCDGYFGSCNSCSWTCCRKNRRKHWGAHQDLPGRSEKVSNPLISQTYIEIND